MRLLSVNLGKWDYSSKGASIKTIQKRIFYKNYIWTPFVWVSFKRTPINIG